VEKSKYHPETKKVFYKRSLSGEELTSPYLDGTLDLSKYEGALWELARGCPFKCSYCYESKGEKKVRLLPMERIEKELKLDLSDPDQRLLLNMLIKAIELEKSLRSQ
jgi:radical SAM superfamily enzyme YgiQ (UPF0313 family)